MHTAVEKQAPFSLRCHNQLVAIREMDTGILITELRKRLGPETYLEHKAQLEKLGWDIEVLEKDASRKV